MNFQLETPVGVEPIELDSATKSIKRGSGMILTIKEVYWYGWSIIGV